MCRVGNDNLCALAVAAALVVTAHHHQTGKLAVGAGIRVEGKLAETAQFCQHLLKVIIEFESTLCCFCRLQRMQGGERTQGGYFLIDFRIVLHGAAA